jgi:anti-sigma B factor antagonist
VILDIFGVTSYAIDGGRVLILTGELDASTAPGLAAELSRDPGPLVVLDLSELTFIDSSGLGAIHAARQRAMDDGGILVVCRPSPTVHRVLEITGLDIWVADWDPTWSKPSDPTRG